MCRTGYGTVTTSFDKLKDDNERGTTGVSVENKRHGLFATLGSNEGGSKHGSILPLPSIGYVVCEQRKCGKTNVMFNPLLDKKGLWLYVFSKRLFQPKYQMVEMSLRSSVQRER